MKTMKSGEDRLSDSSIDGNIRKGLERNQAADNYIRWIVDLCKPYLVGEILEVGAGLGDFTTHFSTYGSVTATEISAESLRLLRRRFENSTRVVVAESRVPEVGSFDSIVMINVLEHIEDDVGAITNFFAALRPGGHFIVYVPAFQLLMSRFDKSIGHHRRYRLKELSGLLRDGGFQVCEARYVNSIGAIGWFIVCRLLKRNASEGASVGIMNRIVIPVIRKVESRFSPPFGISVFCVAQKPT